MTRKVTPRRRIGASTGTGTIPMLLCRYRPRAWCGFQEICVLIAAQQDVDQSGHIRDVDAAILIAVSTSGAEVDRVGEVS